MTARGLLRERKAVSCALGMPMISATPPFKVPPYALGIPALVTNVRSASNRTPLATATATGM